MLQGKRIVLGVSGSIAAFKTPALVRLLKKAGAEVQPILTESAKGFVTPLTLATLAERPALSEFVRNAEGEWNHHVKLGLWADAMLFAPLSSVTMAKMAHGLCDNLLTAVYLSARCPVFFAPAMDLDMYAHPATQANAAKLQSFGNVLIDAEDGELASGLVGKGRMAEPETIVERLEAHFKSAENKPLAGKKALLTAGPTRERIDPVRFLTNPSTGKMGLAIADRLADLGAEVAVVCGPVSAEPKRANVQIISVESALEMHEAFMARFAAADIAVFTAAVSDYRPKHVSEQKIKKTGDDLTLALTRNPDIAAEAGKAKRPGQITVGFALETDDEAAHAADKRARKRFDLLALNSLRDAGAGFGHDTNKITLFGPDGKQELPLMSKTQVAERLCDAIVRLSVEKEKTAAV